jgi:hypothetical protein
MGRSSALSTLHGSVTPVKDHVLPRFPKRRSSRWSESVNAENIAPEIEERTPSLGGTVVDLGVTPTIRRSNPCNSQDRPEHLLIQQEIGRDFRTGEVDLDCLAEVIRELLASNNDAVRTPRNPDLLSPRRRVSHVVGGKT